MYQQIKPSNSISHIVHRYWRMDAPARVHNSETVLPDGCFDIVVDIHKDSDNDVLLTGIWDEPVNVTVKHDVPAVGVRFFPAAIDAVLTGTIAHLKNASASFVPGMIKSVPGISTELLRTSKSSEEIIEFLDYYLTSLLAQSSTDETVLKRAVFVRSKTVSQAAKDAFVSDRQLRRIYQQKLGLSTKNYLSIMRFVHAKHMLAGEKRPLAEIAQTLGYHDQAHFTKEFKKYAGQTPGQFAAQHKASVFYNTNDD